MILPGWRRLARSPSPISSFREATDSLSGQPGGGGGFALVSPDAGTCDACWRDFGDPSNRRFGYPFTNCTHCGPRYTIIRDIPYDRATTTMSAFTMCGECQAEYEDPARPALSCPAQCVRRLRTFVDPVAQAMRLLRHRDSLPIIRQTRALLREGKIVAVKGLGGFCWRAMPPTTRRSPSCEDASGVLISLRPYGAGPS